MCSLTFQMDLITNQVIEGQVASFFKRRKLPAFGKESIKITKKP